MANLPRITAVPSDECNLERNKMRLGREVLGEDGLLKRHQFLDLELSKTQEEPAASLKDRVNPPELLANARKLLFSAV
jgi:hypothetical protein